MTEVIIGIDPHKGSHTAVALDSEEHVLASWPERRWAIEGARDVTVGP